MALFGIGSPPAALSDLRLRAIERKLDLIMAELGIEDAEPDAIAPVREMLEGSAHPGAMKIPAIKRYRELTGVGLATAKEAVDQLCLEIDAKRRGR